MYVLVFFVCLLYFLVVVFIIIIIIIIYLFILDSRLAIFGKKLSFWLSAKHKAQPKAKQPELLPQGDAMLDSTA